MLTFKKLKIMKRVYLVAAGFLFAAFGAKAQSSDFKVGIKGGLNYSNQISSNKDYKTDFIPGFNAGVTLQIPIVGGLSFAPELLLSQKGYKQTRNTVLFGDVTATTRTLNIDAPLLANFNVVKGLNVQVGPQVSFLLNTKNTVSFANGNTFSEEQQKDAGNQDTYRGSIVSGVVGASYYVNPNFDIHARYALDLQKNNKDGSSSDPNYKNQVWQVGVGFHF